MKIRKVLVTISASLLFAVGISAQATSSPAATKPSASTSDTSKKSAVFRPTKDQIKQVQTMLKSKKLYDGEASGIYNDPTRAGIKSFQKDNGLKETGTLNRATLEKFGVELTDGQKLIPASPNSYETASDKKSKTTAKPTSTSGDPKKVAGETDSATAKKPAPFRSSPDQIKAAQKLLKDGKMYSGEESGKLDDATRDGLKKYQEANGVKVTGTLNAATLEKMGIQLTDAQKANAAASTTSSPKK